MLGKGGPTLWVLVGPVSAEELARGAWILFRSASTSFLALEVWKLGDGTIQLPALWTGWTVPSGDQGDKGPISSGDLWTPFSKQGP